MNHCIQELLAYSVFSIARLECSYCDNRWLVLLFDCTNEIWTKITNDWTVRWIRSMIIMLLQSLYISSFQTGLNRRWTFTVILENRKQLITHSSFHDSPFQGCPIPIHLWKSMSCKFSLFLFQNSGKYGFSPQDLSEIQRFKREVSDTCRLHLWDTSKESEER